MFDINFKKNNQNVSFHFSEYIISTLALNQKTQKWLASKCNVTPATISLIVNGKRQPSKKLIYLIEYNLSKLKHEKDLMT